VESKWPDKPKSLCDSAVVEERMSFLHEPHMTDLTRFVDNMREEEGKEQDIPYFDPFDGGVNARCLFLFEAAGGKAIKSGFASRNNCDSSARNFFLLNEEADLDRPLTASWNIVPWALRETGKNRPPKKQDIEDGLRHLTPLLRLLGKVEVVALCGKPAWKAQRHLDEHYGSLKVVKTYHPSPRNINSRSYMWGEISAALSEIKHLLS
jgi:hypothetical protein